MLLNSVIIILREVLEVSLLASLLLSITQHINLSIRWILPSLLIGTIGALIYGMNIATISELNDYTGQELVNGICQILIFFSLLMVIFLINQRALESNLYITSLMATCISLAILREGSEIYIYLSGFISDQEHLKSITDGALIGASIGISISAIVYYATIYRKNKQTFLACQILIDVIGSGILSQVVPIFMQIDLLPAQKAIWDTSFLLPEDSLVGQLIYAIAGYEASPTLLQVSINVLSLCLLLVLIMLPQYKKSKGK